MPAAPPPPHRPGRRLRGWLAAAALAAGAGAWWYAARPRPPEPPALQAQDGADPAVVAAVEAARGKVLAAPRAAAGWGELGMVFGAHGYEPEADRCFAEAERLAPAEPRWPYLRGAFFTVNDPARAEPFLRRAADLTAKDPEARTATRLRLAELLLGRNRLDEAETIFREEAAAAPARVTFGLAQVALARGDRAAARAAAAAVADDPYVRKRAAILLAALAREANDAAAAARHAEAAHALPDDPSWPDPYIVELRRREVGRQGLLREVEALEAAGQLPRAAAILEDLVRTDPTPRILVSAGITLGRLREYARAEALFRDCLRAAPDNVQALYFLAVMIFEQAGQPGPGGAGAAADRLREAERHAARAVELKPDHGLAWLYLGRVRLALGDAAEAVAPLRQAAACRPEFADPHLYLAEALAADGKGGEAVSHARNAEKLAKPGDTRPRQLLDRLGGK